MMVSQFVATFRSKRITTVWCFSLPEKVIVEFSPRSEQLFNGNLTTLEWIGFFTVIHILLILLSQKRNNLPMDPFLMRPAV
jgi:hypothetical protein